MAENQVVIHNEKQRRRRKRGPSQKNAKMNKQGKKKQRPRRPKQQRTCLVLSPCTRSYAKCRLDPFSYSANELPCIPDLYEIPSYKVVTVDRFPMVAGSGGFAFAMIGAHCGSSDGTRGWVSSSTYAAHITPAGSGVTGLVAMNTTRYPFQAAAIRPYRVVATGLRVRYTGTELNRGGQLLLTSISSPPGTSPFAQARDGNAIANYPETKVCPVNRKWHAIGWNPAYPEAYDYDTSNHPLGVAGGANANLVATVNGTTAGNSWECELVTYYEIISGNLGTVPSTTASHSDITGMSYVRDFFGRMGAADIGTAAYHRFVASASSYAASHAMSYINRGTQPTIEW